MLSGRFSAAADEEAAVTRNNHPSVPSSVPMDKSQALQENHKEPQGERTHEPHKKEKSVLQAKLTKLAIQIGYAGEFFFVYSSLARHCCGVLSNGFAFT